MQFTINSDNQKSRGLHLKPVSTSTNFKIFTFTLTLPEGREGETWEPHNKITLFLTPPNKK
jgi:hypothetical protein